MPMTNFPLLVWPIDNGTYLGQIIGTDYSVIDSTPASLRRSASEFLTKAFKQDGITDPPQIDNPKLVIYTVAVQMTYRENNRVYPLPGNNRFKVAAVHGDSKQESFCQCFLPLFKQSFFYYDKTQLKSLIEHFVRDTIENCPPEDAIQYRMTVEPTLDSIRVQITPKLYADRNEISVPEILKETTDQLPLPNKERKTLSRLPEIAWERDQTISSLARRILKDKDNLVLIGDQGVGKTTLWIDAVKIVTRESKTLEQPITVWRTTSQRLISKAKYLGEWQEICDEVIEALAMVNGILWITDLAELIHSGGESPEDSVAAYLQSYITEGQLRLIGEMRPQQMETARSLLPSFIHYFEPIKIHELDAIASAKVLRHYAKYATLNFGIEVKEDALDLSFQLVNRYIKYEKSPGKHVRFFGECIKHVSHEQQSVISRDDIIQIFINYTGIPEILLRDDLALSDQDLMDFFSQRIIGQDPILKKLCGVVQTFKAGLNDPGKPIATLLFAGPTGVGKTAATKALASYFFDAGQSKHPLFRIDMSEFQHPGHIVRLIGDLESPGKLVQHVRTNPFSVVLLDEIEKAHSSVFDALLTVFDEGILTDRFGRTTDFRSSIIIMTSNLGANESTNLGFSSSGSPDVSLTAIKKFFRPEFFNRIDSILSFRSLSREHVKEIAKIEMKKLLDRDRIKELKLTITFSDPLVDYIADTGFSPVYGARPIQRAIEKHVVKAVAEYLESGASLKPLTVDYADGRVVVR